MLHPAGEARRSLLQLSWIEPFVPSPLSLGTELMVRQQQEALGHLGRGKEIYYHYVLQKITGE